MPYENPPLLGTCPLRNGVLRVCGVVLWLLTAFKPPRRKRPRRPGLKWAIGNTLSRGSLKNAADGPDISRHGQDDLPTAMWS